MQLRANRLGILLYREEFDLRDTSMGPHPEGFGSNLSRNISPNATKFFTHILTNVFKQIRIQILRTKFKMGEINDN